MKLPTCSRKTLILLIGVLIENSFDNFYSNILFIRSGTILLKESIQVDKQQRTLAIKFKAMIKKLLIIPDFKIILISDLV